MSNTHTTSHTSAADDHACTGCEVASRRRFIADLSGRVAASLLAVGLLPGVVQALPLSMVSGTHGVAREAGRRRVVNYEIPPADGVSVDADAEVILVRAQGVAYAFALSCPHQNTALRWVAGEGRFQCPKHKSRYQPDGTFISGRATRGMDRYAIAREGTRLTVDTTSMFKQDEDARGWAAALVRL